MNTILPELHQIVDRFPDQKEAVFSLIQDFKEAAPLLATNPALAVCIALAPKWDLLVGDYTGDVRLHLLGIKRRDACLMLGFPGNEATVQILSKITPEACTVPNLMRLRRTLLKQDVTKILRHMPVIDPNMVSVALLWRWKGWASQGLFRELADGFDGRNFCNQDAQLLDDTMRMVELIGIPILPLPSILAARHLHDRLVPEINRRRDPDDIEPEAQLYGEVLSVIFPPSPIPGNDWIEPITTPEILAEEGREQHHCVTIMAQEIADGVLYVYRITSPERATLSIIKIQDVWEIDQLYCAYNENVSGETSRKVMEWLSGNGQSA